jgi:hypothetical protein
MSGAYYLTKFTADEITTTGIVEEVEFATKDQAQAEADAWEDQDPEHNHSDLLGKISHPVADAKRRKDRRALILSSAWFTI